MWAERMDSRARRPARRRARRAGRPGLPVRTSTTAARLAGVARSARRTARSRSPARWARASRRRTRLEHVASPASSRSSCLTRNAGSGRSATTSACRPARCSPPRPSTVCSTAERTWTRCEASRPAVSLNSPSRSLAAITSWSPPGLRLDPDPRPAVQPTERASPRSTSWVDVGAVGRRPTSRPSTWSARPLISWARHGDQAAGPAARASDSVRERSRSSTSARPSTASTRASGVAGSAWSRLVASCGQGEVLADQQLDQVGVGLVRARCLRPPSPGDRRADRGVVGAAARDLADVVEQAGQQQQVGPLDLGQVPLRLGDGLHRVPVDGVPVDRVVLRAGPDRLPRRGSSARCSRPGRAPPRPGSGPGPPTACSSSASRASSGHGVGQRGRMLAEVLGGDGGEDQPALGGERPGAQPESAGRRVGAVGPGPPRPAWMISPCVGLVYSGRRSRRTKLSTRRCGQRPAGRRGR